MKWDGVAWAAVGFMVGGFCGIALACLMVAASERDQ